MAAHFSRQKVFLLLEGREMSETRMKLKRPPLPPTYSSSGGRGFKPSEGPALRPQVAVCQFLVYEGSIVTLWPQICPSSNARPMDIQLMGTNGSNIPTFGSRTVEFSLRGQLFVHDFMCAKDKYPFWVETLWPTTRVSDNDQITLFIHPRHHL